MKITFLGATHEVTGSMTLIEINGRSMLVDCGMEQGRDEFVNQSLPVTASQIECVLVTHAHIDHSGNLPLLYKQGFRGAVYATSATCNLLNIMLRDSAHIQMSEAEWTNRKAQRSGGELIQPLYDMDDAEGLLKKLRPCEYAQEVQPMEGVVIRFTDVGHLLGSAAIEVFLCEDGVKRKIVFSGDVGNVNQPLLRDPQPVSRADYLVLESTYGNRLHEKVRANYVSALAECLQRTFDRGGNVIIPSFAVGRTQEMLYFLRQVIDEGLVHGHDGFPVYVDSPLANEATGIFLQCDVSLFDDETRELVRQGINPIYFSQLRTSVSSDESKAINFDERPKVVLSASGMCEAGRIRHHLKHNLWRKESLILFVGYQAEGTLGRALVDGAKKVKLFGEDISVKAEIMVLPGVSGHADKQGLIDWLQKFEEKPSKVFVNHGDDEAMNEFTNCLRDMGYDAQAPVSGTQYDLRDGSVLVKTSGQRVKRPEKAVPSAMERLIAAINRLMEVARKCEGMANGELNKFTRQVESLCDKWRR